MPSAVSRVQRFEHGGAVLVDEVLGDPSAPPFVLLHGWGGSRESLRGIATLFAHVYAIHLIELPGFGTAPAPPPHWGTSEYADLVSGYFQEAGIRPAVLLGHSFGGRVAVRLASRTATGIGALVLMGVPGLPQPWYSRRALRRRAIRMLRQFLSALTPLIGRRGLEWHTQRFGSKDYQMAGALRPVLVRTVNENLTECARSIACPTLLIWGSDDTETPPWLAERYQRLIGARATLALFPHKDHHLYVGTGAHLCGQRIRSWLETLHA